MLTRINETAAVWPNSVLAAYIQQIKLQIKKFRFWSLVNCFCKETAQAPTNMAFSERKIMGADLNQLATATAIIAIDNDYPIKEAIMNA